MANQNKKPAYIVLSSGVDEDGIELSALDHSTSNNDKPSAHWSRQTGYKPIHLHTDEVTPNKRGFLRSGWRVGATTAAATATLSLTINFIVTVIVSARWEFTQGTSVLHTGDCDQIQRYDTWVHLAINAISTVLLSGSNYCMQVLCAPTRAEVDDAHRQRKYLDIGVPSARNLGFVQKQKRYLWYALGLSSVPLHLLYNSIIFSSLSTNDYNVYFAQESFLNGVAYNRTLFPDYNTSSKDYSYPSVVQQSLTNERIWSNLTKEECIAAYSVGILSNRRDVVLVHDNSSQGVLSKIVPYHFELASDISNTSFDSFSWVCDDNRLSEKFQIASLSYPGYTSNQTLLSSVTNIATLGIVTYESTQGPSTVPYYSTRYSENVTISTSIATVTTPPVCRELTRSLESDPMVSQWSPYEYNIRYCMSEMFQGECSLNYSLPIAVVVMICNILKIIAMCYVAFWITDNPFITVGDAVACFLNCPDPVTKGGCLVANDYFWKNWNGEEDDFYREERLAAGHTSSWFSLTWLFLFALAAIAVFIRYGISHIRSIDNSTITLWGLGFGKPHTENLVGGGWRSSSIIAAILVANSPQPLLSFLYLLFNGMLTAMLSAHEWSHYSKDRKSLRVSTPRGSQRSTYFLQLPYKFSLPLMVVSGTLHWLVSQSLFLANITTRQRGGYIDDDETVSTAGYSPAAMICTLCLGGCMLIFITASSFWKIEADIPFVGSCSAAISAACHAPEDQKNASLEPVQWGVVKRVKEGEIGHCSFSIEEVQRPVEGALYA